MSLKGTRSILAAHTKGAAVVQPKIRRNVRNIMLAVSAILCAIVAAVIALARGVGPGCLAAAVIFVPALAHKFLIPDRPDLKHRFLVAGFYLGAWGIWPMLYLHTMVKAAWAGVLFSVYGVLVLACFLLGAFLPSWL